MADIAFQFDAFDLGGFQTEAELGKATASTGVKTTLSATDAAVTALSATDDVVTTCVVSEELTAS